MSCLAVRLRRIYRRGRYAPKIVHAGSDGFEMRRIDTRSVAAKVIQLKPRGDFANQKFVSHAMGIEVSPLPYENSVAISSHRATPLPATIWPLIDALHKFSAG